MLKAVRGPLVGKILVIWSLEKSCKLSVISHLEHFKSLIITLIPFHHLVHVLLVSLIKTTLSAGFLNQVTVTSVYTEDASVLITFKITLKSFSILCNTGRKFMLHQNYFKFCWLVKSLSLCWDFDETILDYL